MARIIIAYSVITINLCQQGVIQNRLTRYKFSENVYNLQNRVTIFAGASLRAFVICHEIL